MFVAGEAGVGKTTLVDAFLRTLEESREPVRVGRGRCSERLAGSEAYLPVLEVLDSLQRSEQHGSLSRLLRAIAPSWYAQIMPPASNDSSAARLAADTVGGSQERLKREIAVAPRRSQPRAAGRAVDRRRALGGSVDDRSARLSGAAPRDRARADHRHRAGLRARAEPASVPVAEAGSCRRAACAARSCPGLLDEAAIERYLALQFPEHAFPPASPR